MVGRPSFYFIHMKKIDISKLPKYGRLTILSEDKKVHRSGGRTRRYVKVLCDCGNTSVKDLGRIRSGKTTSCGCYHKDIVGRLNRSHKETGTRIYSIWQNIKSRCYNEKVDCFKHYGGRGIIMCDEWKNDYIKFRDWAYKNGYRLELQIDRINNDGNYEPSNCRWVTAKENNNNRRTRKDAVVLEYLGAKKPIKEWATQNGINLNTLYSRIKTGWTIKKALLTPPRKDSPPNF